jgi:hypothetical protein
VEFAPGDVLVALESGMTEGDVSVTQSLGASLRAASAAPDGAAAARGDAKNVAKLVVRPSIARAQCGVVYGQLPDASGIS